MREIKFRMWDEETNKYFTDPKEVMECLKQQAMGMFDHVWNGSVFEQYTGLKDKNGVEIYESDVLNVVCRWDRANMTVEWENGKFVLKTNDGIGYKYLGDMNNVEVIGNIHEQEDSCND